MAKGEHYIKPTAKKSQTTKNKKGFLAAFEDHVANISLTCEAIGISRATYYKWYNDDKKFAEKCKAITEKSVDFSESQLRKLIEGFEYEEVETTYVEGDNKDGKPKIKEYKKKKVHVLPNATAIIFHLKTKGKDRGYVERVENDVTINPFLELMKSVGAEDKE